MGNLANKFGPAHIHGSVDLAGLRSRIVLEDFHHQCRVVRENDARLQHAQKPDLPLGLAERSGGVDRHIAQADAQGLSDRLIEITAPGHPIDRDLITREIDRILELYVDVSLQDLRFGEAITELLQVVRRHKLRLPGALVQFFKVLAMCEGILQAIDPDSRFSDYLHPLLGKLFYQAFAGPQLLGRLRDSALETAELGIELPRRIDRVLGEIERGNLRVWTGVEDVGSIVRFRQACVNCVRHKC
jgi:predicted unusual protein kinase regulating ubiquinone biosynthesis (AarF/ABC1/UbiB family)